MEKNDEFKLILRSRFIDGTSQIKVESGIIRAVTFMSLNMLQIRS